MGLDDFSFPAMRDPKGSLIAEKKRPRPSRDAVPASPLTPLHPFLFCNEITLLDYLIERKEKHPCILTPAYAAANSLKYFTARGLHRFFEFYLGKKTLLNH